MMAELPEVLGVKAPSFVFVCLQTKAVKLETTEVLSTNDFLTAFH